MKLRLKILLILIPLIVIPLLTLGWIAYERLRKNSEQTAFKQADTLLKQVALHIQSDLETAKANIQLFSGSDLLRKYVLADEEDRYDLWQAPLLKLFSSYVHAYPDYYEIRVILPDGYEDTRFTQENIPNAQEEEGESEYFQKMRQSQERVHTALFQNPDNQETAFLVSQKLIFWNEAVQAVSDKATLRGYLAITIRPSFVMQQVGTSNVGKTGWLFFTNAQGRILFHPKTQAYEANLPEALFDRLTQQVRTTTPVRASYQGQRVFFQGTRLRPGLFMFGVLPEAELLSATQKLGIIVTGVTLLSIFLTATLLFVVLNSLVIRPLQDLGQVAREIGTGNLDIRINVSARDEIGELAREFNNMASDLKTTQEEKTCAQVEAIDNLKKADKLKDEILANTSHELRTPLNGIIGIAESLIDGSAGPMTQEQAQNLSMICSSGRRLANLVNDILDFSKLQTRNLQIRQRPTDIRSLTEVVLALSAPLVGQKSLILINQIPETIPLVQADESRLEQILTNLVGNAVKFTHKGQITVSAALEGSEQENGDSKEIVRVSVSDTGIGIPDEKQARIFESFEQADGSTAREYGGTGLGLAVTKQLVELHSGTIELRSTADKGSVFSFTLPVSQDQRGEETPKMTKDRIPENCAPLTTQAIPSPDVSEPPLALSSESMADNGETVMVVDDEPVNIQVLKNHLRSQNYRVLTAQDGFQALEILEQEEPDIIILDLMMPRMSGYEVCQKIRGTKDAASLPVLMLTAKNQISDLVRGLSCGANDYLMKPFSKEELLARTRTHLELKAYHDQLEQRVEERTRDLNETLGKVEQANKRIMQSIQYAERIQRSLLPDMNEVKKNLPDSFFIWMPKDIVGGDIFHADFFEEGFIVAVIDCTGHGVPGALMTMIASTTLRRITRIENCYDPSEILRRLNFIIKTYLHQDTEHALSNDGLDASVCFVSAPLSMVGASPSYTADNRILTFAGAKLPLIYTYDGEVNVIKGDKQSIGYKKSDLNFQFHNHTISMKKGMSFYMHSDGFVDQKGGKKGFTFGKTRLINLLKENNGQSFEDQETALLRAFNDYKNDYERQDDVTMVGFRL